MFLEESNPAAYKRAILVFSLSQIMRQANLEIVLAAAVFLLSTIGKLFMAAAFFSVLVSITTKSIGESEDRPTYKMYIINTYNSYYQM